MNAPVALIDHVKRAEDHADQLHHNLAYRLNALLSAAENLADCHRVLGDFSSHDRVTNGRDSAVFSDACSSWRNPTNESGFELLQGLMQVALDLCSEAGTQAGNLSSELGTIRTTVGRCAHVLAPASKGGEA